MLYAFAFDRLGVVLGDLYFVNPDPLEGQESPEQGVRLELRLFAQGELRGDVYSAGPISIDRPIWRADLLESVDHPGSFDRAHHHPRFQGWNPGPRRFEEEMEADPPGWVTTRLCDLDGLLVEAGVPPDEVGPRDAADLRRAVPEIAAALHRLLDGVRAGELARAPSASPLESARVSWL